MAVRNQLTKILILQIQESENDVLGCFFDSIICKDSLLVGSAFFIIILMQEVVLQPANQNGQAALKPTPDDRQIVVEVKRKIGILKEALIIEREANRKLEDQLYERMERLKKKELDSKKREEKNEALLLEIRNLKDALILERNQKQVKYNPLSKPHSNQSSFSSKKNQTQVVRERNLQAQYSGLRVYSRNDIFESFSQFSSDKAQSFN